MIDPDRDVFQSALSDFTFDAACGGAIRHLADSGFTAKQIMERLDYPISGERVRKAIYKHFCDNCVILEKSPEEELPETKPVYVMEYDSYGKPSYRRKSTASMEGILSGAASAATAWKEISYYPTAVLAVPPSGKVSEKKFGRPGQVISKIAHKGSHQEVLKNAGGGPGLEMLKSTGRSFGWGMCNKTRRDSARVGSGEPAGCPGRGAELSAFLTEKCIQKDEKVYISCDFGIPDSAAARGISLLNGRQQEYLEGIPWPRRRVYHRLDHRMKEILCSLYEQHAYEGNCYFLSDKEKLTIRERL